MWAHGFVQLREAREAAREAAATLEELRVYVTAGGQSEGWAGRVQELLAARAAGGPWEG